MLSDPAIPVVDVSPLFGAPSAARDRIDDAVMDAAATTGSFVAQGFAADMPIDRLSRADLLRVFGLPEGEIRALWRQKFDDAGDPFEPFLYGDYLWSTTTQFVEFKGMESSRRPLRA